MFISFEGIDGVGKSTQARLLASGLGETSREVVLTREPGGAPGAEQIRRLLVEGEPGRWSAETEMLLFFAARRDHVEKLIRPALERGAVVICDRFTDSTRAYQGTGPLRAHVDQLHSDFIGIDPDLTLILDMDPAESLARTTVRSDGGEDRFEKRGAAFQTALRTAYRAIAEARPDRCILIDATQSAEELAQKIFSIVLERLQRQSREPASR